MRTGLPVVGMVGAGELARMTQQAAISLGLSVRLLAESMDDGAALLAADITVGDYRSIDDLRTFAKGCDVLTFEHGHVPVEHLQTLADEGVNVQPSAGALRFAQDESALRAHLREAGIEAAELLGTEHRSRATSPIRWPPSSRGLRSGRAPRGRWPRRCTQATDASR